MLSQSLSTSYVRQFFVGFSVLALLVLGAVQGATGQTFDGTPIVIEHDPSMLVDEGHIEVVLTPTDKSGTQGIFSKDGNGYITGGHIHLSMKNGKLTARIQSTEESFEINSGSFRVPTDVSTTVRVEFGLGGFKLLANGEELASNDYTGGLGESSGGVGNEQAIIIGDLNNRSKDGGVTPHGNLFKGTIQVADVSFLNTSSAPTFQMNVSGGVAVPSGPQREGSILRLDADAPPVGQMFAGWNVPGGVSVENPNSAQTTMMMPAGDVSIAAMFEPVVLADLVYEGDPIIVAHDDSMLANAGFMEAVINPTSLRGRQMILSKDGNGNIDGGHIYLEMASNGKILSRIQTHKKSHTIDSGDMRVPEGEDSTVRVSFGPDGFALLINGNEVGRSDYTGGIGVTSGGSGNEQALVIGAGNNTSRDGGFTPLKHPFKGTISNVQVSFIPDPDDPAFDLSAMNATASPSGRQTAGSLIALEADAPASGEMFIGWVTSSGASIEDAGEPETTMIMPSADTVVEATFGPIELSKIVYRGEPILLEHDDSMLANSGYVQLTINPTNTNGRRAIFSKDGSGYIDGGHLYLEMHNGEIKSRLQSNNKSYELKSGDTKVEANTESTVKVMFGPGGYALFVNGSEVARSDYTGGLGLSSGGSGNRQAIVVGAGNNSSKDGGFTPLRSKFQGEIHSINASFVTDPSDTTPRFDVAVSGGSASPSLQQPEGELILIQADEVPLGQRFAGWTVSGGAVLEDPNAASTNFSMPASDVSLTANVEELKLDGLVVDGEPVLFPHTPEMMVDEGIIEMVVNPKLNSNGYIFSKDGNNFIDGGHINIEVRGNGQVRARLQSKTESFGLNSRGTRLKPNEDAKVRVSFGPGGFRLFIDDQIVDSESYTGGLGDTSGGSGNEQIVVIGGGNNQSNDGGLTPIRGDFQGTLKDIKVSFMGSAVDPDPVFAVTVTNGKADPAGPSEAGATIELTADEAPAGQRFANWTITDGVTLADPMSPETTFTMPNFNVAATANFEVIPTFAITVNGGVANPAGPNPAGEEVMLTADDPPSGQVFDSWTVPDGVEIDNVRNPMTTLVMPEMALTVAANYVDAPQPGDLVYNGEPILIEHDPVMLEDSGFVELVITPESTKGRQGIFSKDGSGFITGGHIHLDMENGKIRGRIQSTNESFFVDSGDFKAEANVRTTVRAEFGPSGFALIINGNEVDRNPYEGGLGTSSGGVGNEQLVVIGALNNQARDGGREPIKYNFQGTVELQDESFLGLGPRLPLVVNSGSGDGEYRAERTVTITADPAEIGMQFAAWTGDVATVADVNSATTTIVTREVATTVTATYEPLPEGFFRLTVNNGQGGGDFEQGTSVQIVADAPATGQQFAAWTGAPADAFANVNAANTTITMPSDHTELTPTYEDILYPLTVLGGSAPDASLALNGTTTVTADAPPAGQSFVGWQSNTPGVLIADVLDDTVAATATLTMPLGGVEIQATFAQPTTGPTTIVLLSHSGGDDVDQYGVTISGRASDPAGVTALSVSVTPPGGTAELRPISVGAATGQWAVHLFEDDLTLGQPTTVQFTATNGNSEQSSLTVNFTAVDDDKRLHKFSQRAMFGATPEVFDDIRLAQRTGTTSSVYASWLDEQLNPDLSNDPELDALGQPEAIVNGVMFLGSETSDLSNIRLRRAIHTRWQLNEVMALFWDNHFNTFASKDGNWIGELDEMDAFRANALGNFRDLLEITTKSPVMMVYLDNAFSDGSMGAPNQNYGREFLELHTVGVDGGYDQDDVEVMSAMFAGWSLETFLFTFKPELHDPSDKVFEFYNRTLGAGTGNIAGRAGLAGIEEAEDVIDLIATHPSTATFLCTKLNEVFVDDSPSAATVSACADVWQSSNANIATVMRHILTSDAFADSTRLNNKVKSPIEYAASLARNFGATEDLGELNDTITQAGMPQFRQPVPTGWYEDPRDWGSGSAISASWELSLEIAAGDADTEIDLMATLERRQLETPEAIAAFLLGVASGDQFTRVEYDLLVEELNYFGPYTEADPNRQMNAIQRALSLALVSPSAIQN